jgi:hypothetical protein
MRPGQPIFGETTHGGWYLAPSQLKTLLVKGGIPVTPPAGGSDGGGLSTAAVAGIATGIAVLLLAALSLFFLHRRPGAAEAT